MPEPRNGTVRRQRNSLLRKYGKYLAYVRVLEHPEATRYIEDVLPLAEAHYWSLMGMASVLLQQQSSHAEKFLPVAEAYLQKSRSLARNDRSKAQRANELYLQGKVEQRKGNTGRAVALFRESLALDKAESNKAREALAALEG